MGDGRSYCYSAGEIRHALRVMHPEQAPPGLVAGFQAFVERDEIARARLAGNHPKRRGLLDRADDLPFTVHEDLMQLGPDSVLTPAARDVLVHPWHLENPQRAGIPRQAESALLLVRFLTLLALAAGRAHPFVALLVLSQLLDQKRTPQISAAWHASEKRPVRAAKPPGQCVLAEPRLARAPNLAGPSSPIAARTVPGCARLGGAL